MINNKFAHVYFIRYGFYSTSFYKLLPLYTKQEWTILFILIYIDESNILNF